MEASQQDSLGGKHFRAALEHVKAPFILTPWKISFHSLFFHNLTFTFRTNAYIKNKGRQQGEKPPFKQLGCEKKKKPHVWHDVAPAGRRVERAGGLERWGSGKGAERRKWVETGGALCGEPVTLPGHLSGPVCRLSGSSPGWDRQAAGSNMETRAGRMYEGQMNWCMQIYVRSGRCYNWDFKGHMICTQRSSWGWRLSVAGEWEICIMKPEQYFAGLTIQCFWSDRQIKSMHEPWPPAGEYYTTSQPQIKSIRHILVKRVRPS